MQGFIVCRDRHPFSASHIHDTLKQAQVEAERLCRKEQDTFLVFVLCGEARLAQAPVTWTWASNNGVQLTRRAGAIVDDESTAGGEQLTPGR